MPAEHRERGVPDEAAAKALQRTALSARSKVRPAILTVTAPDVRGGVPLQNRLRDHELQNRVAQGLRKDRKSVV